MAACKCAGYTIWYMDPVVESKVPAWAVALVAALIIPADTIWNLIIQNYDAISF